MDKRFLGPESYKKWFLSLLAFLAVLECFLVFYTDYSFGLKLAFPAFFFGTLVSIADVKSRSRENLSHGKHKKTGTLRLLLGLLFAAEILMAVSVYFRLSDAAAITNGIKGLSAVVLLAGIVSVLLSRIQDQRWLSVYVICMAMLLFSCMILSALYDMDLSASYGIELMKRIGYGGVFSCIVFISASKWDQTCSEAPQT